MGKRLSRPWILVAGLWIFLCGCTATSIELTPSLSPMPEMSSPDPTELSRTSLGTSPAVAEEPTTSLTSLPPSSSPTPAMSRPELLQPSRTPIGASPQAAGEISKEKPTFTPNPPWVPTLTPTPIAHPDLRVETLPRPLYFIAANSQQMYPNQLWRLDPGASKVVAVTPAEMAISAAAIWQEDGRLAYSTETGELYVAFPGESPRLLVDVEPSAEGAMKPDRPFINSLTWSSNGEMLAYSVWSYSDVPLPEADGLWLLNLANGEQIKLMDNRYLDRETDDVFEVRTVQPLAWSADDKALLVRMNYWEWSDVAWIEPIAPVVDESNLYDPEGMWVDGFWSANGQSVWLTGNGSIVSDLAQAERARAEVKLVLDGNVEGLAFYQAQELPEGLAFLGIDVMTDGVRPYMGHETTSDFTYEAVGPADALCNGELAVDIAWDPTGQWAVVSCNEEVTLISLKGGSEENLTPFLEPLTWITEQRVVFWGPQAGNGAD